MSAWKAPTRQSLYNVLVESITDMKILETGVCVEGSYSFLLTEDVEVLHAVNQPPNLHSTILAKSPCPDNRPARQSPYNVLMEDPGGDPAMRDAGKRR